MLKIAWTAVLLTVAGAHTGSWRASVLDVWSTSCTMLPDPAPYPRELLRLADGHASLEGVRELFTCYADTSQRRFLPLR